jgi:DNA-binding response OmpR family regulator
MDKKVLFINNINAFSIIPRLLAENGYTVDTASDAEAGWRRLDERSYSLVMVLENPAAESWRLCGKIRRLTNIPLIVISANASTDTCVKAINTGADYFLRKPFGTLELLARMDSLLQRASLRQTVPIIS